MDRWVEITFDCLPLRTVGRMDIPLDASPGFRVLCERIKAALEAHGSFNSYFLYNARCVYRLTNDPALGMLEFSFDGTILTDEADEKSRSSDLRVELVRDTCPWLTEPIVHWFQEAVSHAVRAEFNRYIAAGDLQKAKDRIERIQAESDEQGGFVGMFL